VKIRTLRFKVALLCAMLVAVTLILFAILSAVLFYREQLDALLADRGLTPSLDERAEAQEGVMLLLSTYAVILPFAAGLAAIIAWFSARHFLRHLKGLADAADQVSMQNLHDRVPIASTADEVARLTLAFNSLLERLEHSFTRIKRFTADASHEFRLPLTLMKCEVEDALRDPEAIAQASTFERVLQEINRLNRICDSLLFLAGADSGTIRLDFSRIDLSLLCQEIIEDIRTIAEPKSIAFTADVQSSVFLNCDVHLIRRLLLNLLDNALKYNHAEGWIRLHVGLKAGLAVIAVANSGPEIPAEHRAHLFEPFYRADNSRSRRTGGTGLGLSICREIVALHQGTIRLRKSTGEETIFEVSLPTI